MNLRLQQAGDDPLRAVRIVFEHLLHRRFGVDVIIHTDVGYGFLDQFPGSLFPGIKKRSEASVKKQQAGQGKNENGLKTNVKWGHIFSWKPG